MKGRKGSHAETEIGGGRLHGRNKNTCHADKYVICTCMSLYGREQSLDNFVPSVFYSIPPSGFSNKVLFQISGFPLQVPHSVPRSGSEGVKQLRHEVQGCAVLAVRIFG